MHPGHCLLLAFALAAAAMPAAAQRGDGPVVTEFRAFNGTEEVTTSTRFRLTPAGGSDGAAIEVGRTATLAAGLYDVQALRADRGVVAIKRVERLAVMHYPDEGGRHLEVVNFRSGFGALQLRAARGPLATGQVSIFRAGTRQAAGAPAIQGDGYVLFVVPAGQYDIRLDHAEHGGAGDSHWLLNVTVAADRTRLQLLDAVVTP